jgi:excisionase family DNA binding protein
VKQEEAKRVLLRLRDELAAQGRKREVQALEDLIVQDEAVFLKLRKRYYTPAEVADRVGVSRQTVVKWIERGELDAELTPGGHHRIPAAAFTLRRSSERSDLRLIPARR